MLNRITSRPRLIDLAWLLLLATGTLLIYGSSLGYPFFWVDPIDIGLAHSRSILTILTNSEGYLYYRPFAFILWKSLHALSGRFDPFVFHSLHVLMHLLNSMLMYGLAKRVFWLVKTPRTLSPNPSPSKGEGNTGRPAPSPFKGEDGGGTWNNIAAGLAAMAFAWYPASHQTVTWVISPQVQAMTFLLAAAIVYLDGRTSHNRRKYWFSLILLALALPFHENAVLFGPILFLLEAFLITNILEFPRVPAIALRWQVPLSSLLKPLPHIALCLAFAALWLIIPKDPESAVARFEPATGWYLLQGLIWPVAGVVGSWREWLAGVAWRPLIYVAPPVLLLLFMAYYRARRLALLVFGLGWFVLMVLPVWVTRDISYAGVSPRIFYTAAPGAIFVWVGLLGLQPFARRPLWQRLWQVGTVALVVAILGQSLWLVVANKRLHDGGMAAIWDVVESGQRAGNRGQLLYINVPDQITPVGRPWPVGYFRAVLMPVSVELGQYAELQTGVRPQTQSYAIPALAGLEQYPYQVDMRGVVPDPAELSRAIRAADVVYIGEYDPAGLVRVVKAGRVEAQVTVVYQAVFSGRAGLVTAEAMIVDGEIQLTSGWDCLGQLAAEDTLFVHLVDTAGQLVAQADGDPLRGLFALAACRPGERIQDIRYLPVAAAGAYTIHLGMYNRMSGERLVAVDGVGRPLVDSSVVVEIVVP